MAYEIARNESEIDDCLNAAVEAGDVGTRWPGMSYEDGVAGAILWLIGLTDDNPMED